jgi:hypothetical protein
MSLWLAGLLFIKHLNKYTIISMVGYTFHFTRYSIQTVLYAKLVHIMEYFLSSDKLESLGLRSRHFQPRYTNQILCCTSLQLLWILDIKISDTNKP